MPSKKLFSPRVDQSMFENSVAQQQSPQSSRPGQLSARRSPASTSTNLGTGAFDSPSSGGQQRLKNAINLGKAVGAKVNDLLRRKETSHFGDIGVTEVNKNIGAMWSCMDQINQTTANSHVSSFDSFPRLEPPPPTGKKRVPRALKTTQDMMISSDPVVSCLETADSSSSSSSSPPSADKTPLIAKEQQLGEKEEKTDEGADTEMSNGKTDGVTGGVEEDSVEDGSGDGGMETHQLQLSVPDIINKESKPCDVWQKAAGPDSRLASTPRSGKTPYRISLEEEAPLGKKNAVGTEEAEPHPDLLLFE
ncbi:hypothetical protein LDENG_00211250 [Lucifuga dentata]|nr:hypothetical protein LDENG_00211250 [Lucifuga dentata]